MMLTVGDINYHLIELKQAYMVLLDQREELIDVLKPFAFSFQNAKTNDVEWEDFYRAHHLLLDLMNRDEYLKEAKDAR
jgi:hypothetical protein